MIETQSNTQFNEKLAILARTTENHDHEIHEINQKLDAMTMILRRLNKVEVRRKRLEDLFNLKFLQVMV